MYINPLWPGTTVNLTCGDGWQRLADLLGGDQSRDIFQGGQRAQGVTISVGTNAAQVAYGENMPSVTGHPMAVGDTLNWTARLAINRLWIRNAAAGSNAVAIVTPLFAS